MTMEATKVTVSNLSSRTMTRMTSVMALHLPSESQNYSRHILMPWNQSYRWRMRTGARAWPWRTRTSYRTFTKRRWIMNHPHNHQHRQPRCPQLQQHLCLHQVPAQGLEMSPNPYDSAMKSVSQRHPRVPRRHQRAQRCQGRPRRVQRPGP